MQIPTSRDGNCFCCGQDNEQGLKLRYTYPARGKAETQCLIPPHFSGWRNLTHGGFLAMLLDETMAHACLSQADTGVTVEMTVRYLKPVATGQPIRVSGEVVQVRSRIIETRADITTEGGEHIAQGRARFLKIS